MPLYMTQASYSAESWAAQISSPEDRAAAIGGMIEAAGGKLPAGQELSERRLA
jgi:hypothetical protein